MTSTSTPPWHQHWLAAAASVNERQVFFIVGCQKSGTTWVRKLLDAHPQVACNGEGHYADTLLQLLQDAAAQYNQAQSSTSRLDASLQLTDDDLRSMLKLLCDRQLAKYIEIGDGPADVIRAVGDKTPEHANAIGLLRRLYPAAKFIHVIRDGRDAAVSGWAHLKRQGRGGDGASFRRYVASFAGQHWKPYITNARTVGTQLGDDYLEVRYEDLHAEPIAHMQRLAQLLNVDGADDVVQRCIDAASFRNMTGGRAPGEEDPHSFLRKGVVGDWMNHFDDDAVRRFNDAAGDLLRELNYKGHGHARSAPSAAV